MNPPARIVLVCTLGLAGALLAFLDAELLVPVLALAVGGLAALRVRDRERVHRLEERLRALEARADAPAADPAYAPVATPPPVDEVEVQPAERRLRRSAPQRAQQRSRPSVSWAGLPPWARRAWAFATGGNPIVRVFLLVLFVGLGLLVREFASTGLQLGLVAAAGVGLAAVGWRLRRTAPSFALTLQGGGVAVLYLTVYAAYALYALVPSLVAIGLMAAVAVACAGLALVQDAPGLAVLGVAGGFGAPVLAGTAEGNDLLLLSYYALLNLGVLGIAWTRGWRSLAVVGFLSTFVTGGLWGGLSYRPDLYATVQPFVVLNFAVYFALAIRFALRSARAGVTPERALAVDGALVFGLPAATFVLQANLIEAAVPYGRAWSAAALAAVYLASALALYRQPRVRLVADAFLAVGIVFGTLALPLAFQRVVFGAMWVLEGAGLVWVGARQRRWWMRWGGLALQAAAASVLFVEGVLSPDRAFNAETLTGWIVAVALGLSAYVLRGGRAADAAERLAGRLLLGFALFWWATTAAVHTLDLAPASYEVAGLLGAAAASAALFLGLGRTLRWRGLAAAAYGVVAAGWVLWLLDVIDRGSPAAGWSGVAWLAVAGVAGIALQAEPARSHPARRWAFVGGSWLAVAVVADALSESARAVTTGAGWAWGVVGVAVAVGLALVLRLPPSVAAPVERRQAALGLVAAASGWLLLSLGVAGDTEPLPFVPLLNPVDGAALALLLVLVAAVRSRPSDAAWLGPLVSGLGFLALSAAVLRAAHQWAAVPWASDALLASATAQAALAVVWTLLALALAVVATRTASRALWFFGAGVLALVVAKLFLVDLAQAQALVLIGAFIAVGVLGILIGYVAPLPPRRPDGEVSVEP